MSDKPRVLKFCNKCGHSGMGHTSVQCWADECKDKTCGIADCTLDEPPLKQNDLNNVKLEIFIDKKASQVTTREEQKEILYDKKFLKNRR